MCMYVMQSTFAICLLKATNSLHLIIFLINFCTRPLHLSSIHPMIQTVGVDVMRDKDHLKIEFHHDTVNDTQTASQTSLRETVPTQSIPTTCASSNENNKHANITAR